MSAELFVLLILLSTTALAAFLLRRVKGETGPWWAAAWIALVSGAIYGQVVPSPGASIRVEWLLTSMFPFFTLAGALAHSGRPVPPQLFIALAGYVLLRFACMAVGLPALALALGLAVEPCVLLAAAYAVRRSPFPGGPLTQTLLPVALAAVVVPRIVDTVGDLRSGPGDDPILLWMAFGWPLGLLQLLSRLEVARRSSRAATDALEQNLRRFDAMAQSAFDLIVETDESARIVYASPSFRTVLGYEPSELIGVSGFDLIHPDDLKLAAAAAADFRPLDNMAHPPIRILHRDGSWRWIEGTARRYEGEDGAPRSIMVSRDVTSRLRAEAAVRSSEDRLRTLGEHSADVITELDPEGRISYVSSNVERTLGYSPEELVGRGISQLALHIGAELPAHADQGLATVRARGSLEHLFRVRRGDGAFCWMETSVAAFPRPDGRKGFIAVSRDVTERRILEEKVRQADRLESLALLAGGVAHDFNNLLTPILGNASLLRRQLPPDLSLHALTRDIEQSALRAGEMTQQLLAYTGRSHAELEPVQLADLIEELGRLFEKELPSGVALRRKLPRELPWIKGDRAQLRRAIMNLLSNALEAVGEGPGEIEIGAGTAVLRETDIERLEAGDGLLPGTYVVLEVSDPGHGIDEGTRSRIFDPFFTTKPTGQGLGLAALHGLARSHGAGIEVRTEPGQGSSFRVFFPRTDARVRRVGMPKRPHAPITGDGLVLVADNEDPVRRVAVRALRQAGFRTIEARDGHEAVEQFRRHAGDVVAVLLDVTMPQLRGDEAFLEMRKVRADVPAVFSSGFSREKVDERLPQRHRISFLQKPYLAEDLLERLLEVLG
ncbi:MAG: PAS domain S-box protein [Myxococcota bacterium]|nr:PAS domain S-box protein [Myxococcota bacterium]